MLTLFGSIRLFVNYPGLCCICNLVCVGDRGRCSTCSIVHVLRRAHIARHNCGDANFCGLELLWWLPSKPSPCMHNYACIAHWFMLNMWKGAAPRCSGSERTVRTRWRRSGSAASRLVCQTSYYGACVSVFLQVLACGRLVCHNVLYICWIIQDTE